jgi:hypothetical protein
MVSSWFTMGRMLGIAALPSWPLLARAEHQNQAARRDHARRAGLPGARRLARRIAGSRSCGGLALRADNSSRRQAIRIQPGGLERRHLSESLLLGACPRSKRTTFHHPESSSHPPAKTSINPSGRIHPPLGFGFVRTRSRPALPEEVVAG